MNTETGDIRELQEKETELSKIFSNEVPVEEDQMTEKQKKTRKVSLHDHTSNLGKLLTRERKARGLTRDQYRKMRRKGLLR